MHFKSLLIATLLATLSIGKANALFVTDLNPNDANEITRQEFLATIPEVPNAYGVWEDYNETKLIPYPSHDGFGIVNQQFEYFDKIVDLGTETGWWTMVFQVTNTTPYIWSDYHFEFWSPDFQTRLFDFPLGEGNSILPVAPCSNEIFENDNCSHLPFEESIAEFWAPDWQNPGQENDYTLTMNFDAIRTEYGLNSFGLRQVATTRTPEPTSMLSLLVLGGLSIVTLKLKLQ